MQSSIMITKELVAFIKKSKSEGHSDQSIKDVLVKNGWLPADVEEGFKELLTPSAPPVPPIPPAPAPAKVPVPEPSISNVAPASFTNPGAIREPQVSSIAESFARPATVVKVMPKKSRKGMLVSMIVILFLLAVGVSGYYFRENLKTLPVVKKFFPAEQTTAPIVPSEENPVVPATTQNSEIRIINSGGGVVTLANVANINFPAGFFSNPTTVQVTKVNDKEAIARFTEFEILFNVKGKIDYQVQILANEIAPEFLSDNFFVSLSIPNTLTIPKGSMPIIFGQVFEDGGMETVDNFQPFLSVWNSFESSVSATIPKYVFTNKRQTNGQYEAILTIGVIPEK